LAPSQGNRIKIIGGRTGMGKSTLAINLATNAATSTDKYSVALISAGLTARQISMRMMAAAARVELNSLRKGTLKGEDWHKLAEFSGQLTEANMIIADTPDSLATIQLMCRHLKHETQGLDLVFIDDLQSLAERIGIKQTVHETSAMTQALKSMAVELDVPVVVTSQLKPTLEARTDKRPCINDLCCVSAIEQTADVIFLLYREEVYHQQADHEGDAEIIIAKQCYGELTRARLLFNGKFSRFDELDTVDPVKQALDDAYRKRDESIFAAMANDQNGDIDISPHAED